VRRDDVDDILASRSNPVYQHNHVLVLEAGYQFHRRPRGFLRSQFSSNLFMDELPVTYNSSTSSCFGNRYSVLTLRLRASFQAGAAGVVRGTAGENRSARHAHSSGVEGAENGGESASRGIRPPSAFRMTLQPRSARKPLLDSTPMKTSPFSALLAPLRTVLMFSLVINLALLAPSIFMLQVFDRVLTTRSVETLLVLGVIAVTTLALMGVLEYFRSRSLSGLGILLEQQHGPRLLAQLLRAAARAGGRSYLDGMRDLAVLRGFIGGPGVVAFCDAPWTIIYLVIIYLFHPALGILATVFIVVLVLLAWVNERATRDTIGQLTDSSRVSGRLVDNALRSAEVITALGMQPAITQRWQTQNHKSHRLQLALSNGGGAITAISRVSRQLVQVVMLGFGAYLVIHDNATPGIMLATTIILARAMAPVEMLIGSWKNLVEARGAYGRLHDLLGATTEGAVGTELPRPTGRLAVEGLSYTPPGGDRPLLRGVTLAVEPGHVLAVVGPSGSGKTTMARLLAGVTQPTAGTVRLDGADIRSWDPVRLGGWMGYVPQDVALFDGTVSENIARLGPVDSAAVLQAAQRANVHEMLLRLPMGYDTPVGDGGSRLSGGQRQRVALARALYGQPALVVMDEPDASLDADGEAALLETIRGMKALGTTVVVVTQRRAVLAVADSVVVMKDGAIDRIANVEANPQRPTAVTASPGQT